MHPVKGSGPFEAFLRTCSEDNERIPPDTRGRGSRWPVCPGHRPAAPHPTHGGNQGRGALDSMAACSQVVLVWLSLNSAVTSVPCLVATAPSRRHMAWTSCLVASPEVSLVDLWFAALSAASRALFAAEHEANMVMSRMMMTPVESRAGVGFRENSRALAGGFDAVVMASPMVVVAAERPRSGVRVGGDQRRERRSLLASTSAFRVPARRPP